MAWTTTRGSVHVANTSLKTRQNVPYLAENGFQNVPVLACEHVTGRKRRENGLQHQQSGMLL